MVKNLTKGKIVLLVAVIIIVIVVCILFLTRFFLFGSPDSPLVDLVGKNLPGFVEYEKTGSVSISDIEKSSIVYLKKTYSDYEKAGEAGDDSFLVLKRIADDSEVVIFRGNLGHQINNVFVDQENQSLVYTFEDNRGDYGKTYLVVFDLETMLETGRILMLDKDNYINDEHFLGAGAYVYGVLFDETNHQILFQVEFRKDSIYYNATEYFILDIRTGNISEISEGNYDEASENLGNNSFTYVQGDSVRELFFVYPSSDYLPANYKHKYNGVYINDGANNIRISRSNYGAGNAMNGAFWFANGQYVIIGSFLYDTSGRREGARIVDGAVLAVW